MFQKQVNKWCAFDTTVIEATYCDRLLISVNNQVCFRTTTKIDFHDCPSLGDPIMEKLDSLSKKVDQFKQIKYRDS